MTSTSDANQLILHITTDAAWSSAQSAGAITDPSLDSEGFIHCSTAAQVLIPANERFAGRADLILLVIDPALLTQRLVFEDSYGSGHEFPHVYGPINPDAVLRSVPSPCRDDGTFVLPSKL